MRWLLLCCLLLVLGWVLPAVDAGPLKGAFAYPRRVKIQPQRPTLVPPEVFKGGERACVIVQGDRDPPMNITLKVLDENQQVVASDDRGGDFAAVIWYPPRDAPYFILIETDGNIFNNCYISFK